jgi:hypothetical protein
MFFCFLEKSFKKESTDDCWLKSAILGETMFVTITGRSLRIRAMTKSPAFSEVWILRTEKNV